MHLFELADSVADLFARIRSRAPRVHCITNSVAQQYTANMLLAAGAVPSMTLAPDEIGGFVAGADALLVNLGTFDAERKSAIGAALSSAAEHGVPWLLDPVFIERSPGRAQFARDLVGRGPAVVRLNGAEFAALDRRRADSRRAGAFRAKPRHHRGADRRDGRRRRRRAPDRDRQRPSR